MRVRIGRFHSGAEESIGVHAELDIERLVESRAIVQAASGFGKSYLLCELIEATHGHIQQIIIDPEGEFSPLRSNRDFVIASASGGDALAHPRTAGLLATRLLETKASAILDIYDVKTRERHEFVRNFLVSMMEAKKDLWHPVLVFLDEAHLFCPEKGFGESEATDVVIDLAGRGRKRGFTLVAATQRIGKFNKNALAELNNKFIGSASLDIDVKRAAFELGRNPKDALTDLRKLKPGQFYAFGPALHIQEPSLFHATLPETKLPKAGHRKLVAPPKPTAAIKALLPQLADIPKEVEQKAKTEAELRKELASAQRELENLKRSMTTQVASLVALKQTPKQKKLNFKAAHREAKVFVTAIEKLMTDSVTELRRSVDASVGEWLKTVHHRIHHDGANAMEVIRKAAEAQTEMEPPLQMAKYPRKIVGIEPPPEGDAHITGPEQRILDAIAWLKDANGRSWQSNNSIAFVAGYSPNGGGYLNPRGRLKQRGMIEYNGLNEVSLTDAGAAVAKWSADALTSEEIHRRVKDRLDGPMTKILQPLLDAYPQAMSNEELASAAGYAAGGGGYLNPRGRLKSLGLVEYADGGVRASKELFV